MSEFLFRINWKKRQEERLIHTWYNRDGGSNPKEQSQEWVRNELQVVIETDFIT